jgi:RNA polymerase sigma-70 factor, ECF subfamily
VTDQNVNYNRGLDSTSLSLLKRVRAQDRLAWDRLVSLYGPLVYQWCRKHGLSSEEAEDAGQEVFAAVYRNIEDFQRKRKGQTFRGWLRVIVHHKACDFQRKRLAGDPSALGGTDNQQELLEIVDDEPREFESDATPSETGLLARRALELLRAELTVDKWQAFYRVVVVGESPAEVAAALGLPVNVVYLAKSRGLRRLREEFGELIDFG